jgi:phosphoglycerate dehydrogenase-like enzyme
MLRRSELEAAMVSVRSPRLNTVDAVIALTRGELDQFFPEGQAARLNSLFSESKICDPDQTKFSDWLESLRTLRPRIIVTAWRTPRLPFNLAGTEYVCHIAGSVRGLVPRELIAAGLKVTNWGNTAAPLVAEQALLLILGALRSMPKWERFLAESHTHADSTVLQTRSLRQRRVAIHGFGLIARELVKLLRPFNVDISAYSAGVPREMMLEHGVRPAATLEDLAAGADVFVTCEALTDKTRGSIGRSVLSKLEPDSVFVNVGRGAVVNEEDLALVAAERGLRVASDVFTEEPLPRDSILRGIPGSLYSPHIGGPTLDWYPRCGASALENIDRFLQGQPLLHEVTLDIFDRST